MFYQICTGNWIYFHQCCIEYEIIEHRAGSSMLENKYSSTEQARACLKTKIRARACSSIEKFYMIELLPGHLTKNALFLPKCVYFQRLYCIEYEKIEHRAGSSMLKNENSSIEHARSSKIGFGRAFFGLEHARVQHYQILTEKTMNQIHSQVFKLQKFIVTLQLLGTKYVITHNHGLSKKVAFFLTIRFQFLFKLKTFEYF